MNLLSLLGLLFVSGVILVVLWVVLRIGAGILRCSVSATNQVLGVRRTRDQDFYDDRGYYQRGLAPRPKSLAGLEIPLPTVFQAILINLATGIVGSVAQFAVVFAGVALGQPGGRLATADTPLPVDVLASLVSIPVGLLAQVVVLSMALPTSCFRAGVVMAFQLLIYVLIGAAVVGAMVASGVVVFPAMPAG